MYLKYFLESGIFAQDSKDSESRTLFYFVTDPSASTLASMDVVVYIAVYPFTSLENSIIVPISVSTGLSEDRVSFSVEYSPHCCLVRVTTVDSLCTSTFRGNTTRILYEVWSTSIKS